jgi:hypothetical protein
MSSTARRPAAAAAAGASTLLPSCSLAAGCFVVCSAAVAGNITFAVSCLFLTTNNTEFTTIILKAVLRFPGLVA